jgi:hypothetical protein
MKVLFYSLTQAEAYLKASHVDSLFHLFLNDPQSTYLKQRKVNC